MTFEQLDEFVHIWTAVRPWTDEFKEHLEHTEGYGSLYEKYHKDHGFARVATELNLIYRSWKRPRLNIVFDASQYKPIGWTTP